MPSEAPTGRLRLGDVRYISTFRLTVAMGLIFAIGIVVLLASIYILTARELTERSDRILREEAASLLATPAEDLPYRIRAELARNVHDLNYFALISASGEFVAGNIRTNRLLVPDRPVDIPANAKGRGPLRLLPIQTDAGETILVGRDTSQIADLRRSILMILVASGVVLTTGVLAGGVALSMRPLKRVRDLQATAAQIAKGNLDLRMPIIGAGDELDQFAATVNGMVEEVGHVVGQVKGVTDAIAHDLRTPLTRVRAQLHRARRAEGIAGDTAALIGQSIDDLDLVLERFTALLRISELEASGRRSGFGAVELSILLRNVCELYEPLAEDREIAFSADTTQALTVNADEKLLFEAVSNLVDNAIKFTPRGGNVRLGLRRTANGAVVEVSDDGPGIDADERIAVLRRFHRGARATDVPGSGLGLSVVTAIAHIHGFRLELDRASPGLVARLVMMD